jgi:hypothetical protein
MATTFTLKLNHMLKKSIISATMLGIVVIALASSGGGKKKKAAPSAGIIPVRANGSFSLKARPTYAGSQVLSTINLRNSTVYKSIITYQKGNTTFIVPTRYKVTNPSKLSFGLSQTYRSNLKMVDLKLNLTR